MLRICPPLKAPALTEPLTIGKVETQRLAPPQGGDVFTLACKHHGHGGSPDENVKHGDAPAWKRWTHHFLHSAHLLIEAGEMANVLTGAAIGGLVGATVVSVGMLGLGVSHIVDGVRARCGEQIMEGVGALLLGARSGLDALQIGSAHHSALHVTARSLHPAIAVLGVAHGGAETLLGVKRVIDGVRHHDRAQVVAGGLTIGLGTSICAASLGAGPPAILAAGAFLFGRIAFEERKGLRAAVAQGVGTASEAVSDGAEALKWRWYTA